MASLSRDPNGCRRILFYAADGRRRTIRLGKLAKRHAEEIKVRVESLNAAAIAGMPIDGETATWIAKLEPKLRDKLAEHRDQVFLGKDLSTIVRDLPIDFDLESARLGDYDRETVIRLFREYEFRTLIERLPPMAGETAEERTQRLARRAAERAPAAEQLTRHEREPRPLRKSREASKDAE